MEKKITASENAKQHHTEHVRRKGVGIYWMLWMVIAIAALLSIPQIGIGGVIVGILCAIYALYLYKGGTIVILPIPASFLVTLIIGVILLLIGLAVNTFQHIAAGGLTEDSLCNDYNHADTKAKDIIIGDMYRHQAGNSSSQVISVARISVNAFCRNNPDKPINGIFDRYNQYP